MTAGAPRAPRLTVLRSGSQLDLRVDGISYSVADPLRPWSGWVWDALAAPVLLARAPAPSVLLLGCGGGTVLALVRRLVPAARMTAVELDPRILEIGRRRFGLDEHAAHVVEADGVEYLRRTRRRFDLIVDDMYAPGAGGLTRPVADEAGFLALVASRLAAGGIAATNATTDDDPPGLEAAVRGAYRATFPAAMALAPRRGDNVVLVGARRRLAAADLTRAAARLPAEEQAAITALRVRRA